MYRKTILLLVLLFLAPLAFAQSKDELKFRGKQANKLESYAASAYKEGFPRIAKRVWLMLLSEYEPDNGKARAALGYEKIGDTWVLDPDADFKKEDSPDPGAAKRLQKKWVKLSKDIANAHRLMGEKYQKAGRTDMSKWHYEKVLFFLPDDHWAQEALDHKPVAGLTGTDLEKTLYERSKKIEKAVAVQARKDYPVERLPDTNRQLFLDNAKVEYISVQSEHFIVRGNFDEELLMEAARNAERGLRVMQVAMEGYEGFSPDPKRWVRDWAYFKDDDTYKQILNANAHIMKKADLEFRLEHSSSSVLFSEGIAIEVGSANNEQGLHDGVVRNVAQSYSAFSSAALREGIGHTIVGMFFNNNRHFVVDRREQLRTTTGEEDLDKFSPNMDTWKDLALEAAWKLGEGTPAAQLPLITADKFPDDARIKSWSFCDYVTRRDPGLLVGLDQLGDQRVPHKVEEAFTAAHDGLSLAQLEKEWKDFWTEASPVLRAIRSNTEPLSSVSPDVSKVLAAFNKARKEVKSTKVTWSDSYSGRCREHVEYLLLNPEERGPALEQQQNIELGGGSHLGDMFAQMALVNTEKGKLKNIFKDWLDLPGYRDALLSNRLRTIGLYSKDGILVIDAIRGVGTPAEGKGGYRTYPQRSQSGVPTKVEVARLGPEVQAALEKAGHGDAEYVGYPISLHYFGPGLAGVRDSYECSVMIQAKKVKGLVHLADGGTNRCGAAPGMAVFYPYEPLRKGMQIEVIWTWEDDGSTSRARIEFNT